MWVGDSKNVIVFDPLLAGHVIRCMRSGHRHIFTARCYAIVLAMARCPSVCLSVRHKSEFF